jgi:hypothetical protein
MNSTQDQFPAARSNRVFINILMNGDDILHAASYGCFGMMQQQPKSMQRFSRLVDLPPGAALPNSEDTWIINPPRRPRAVSDP